MIHRFKAVLLSLCLFAFSATASAEEGRNQVVEIHTTVGVIVVALDAEHAPNSVNNFMRYAVAGAYDDTLFHRVIPGFMIQGGGFDQSFKKRATLAPIRNEAANGLKNLRGTIAMARTGDPHSATNQFFINLKDNAFLDFRAPTARDYGYTVFGRVIDGMDVVDRIAMVSTRSVGQYENVPVQPIFIKTVVIRRP